MQYLGHKDSYSEQEKKTIIERMYGDHTEQAMELFRKLYPEGDAEARFKISRTRGFLYYCNKHGLFKAPASYAGPSRRA